MTFRLLSQDQEVEEVTGAAQEGNQPLILSFYAYFKELFSGGIWFTFWFGV